ncbi:beta/gamma crystallin domain-containing protein 2 isoform X2 [Lithobates pipiens]
MEKRDKLKKDNKFPKRVQAYRMPEIQRSCETSKWSVKKDIQQNVNISNNLVGHVKKIQKIFEDIGSKDIVSHDVEPVKSMNVPQREKDYVSDQEVSTAGLHRPIFSQVFNPLKKEHLENKIEHASISVIDSSGKLHPCIIMENYADTIEDIVENNDSLGKDFEDNHLSNSHKDSEAFQRHPRPTLQDLQLAPRTPTSPSQKIKNNFSFSLGSPKGWKNESAVIRPTKHFIGQIFENQRDTTPVSTYKSNVFFTEENVSNYITDSDLQQKGEQTNHNRVIQSQKEHRTEFNTIAPNLVYDESPAISTKQKLDKSGTVRGLALLKNKIQEEYKKHEDLKQTVETQSKITNLRLGQKNTIESDALDLENQEGSTEEARTEFNTIAPNLVYDESPAISAKEKLDKIRTARGLALLKNKIQEEYKKHEDLKQTVETQSKITNLRLGQKNRIESDALDLENQEGSTEEPRTKFNTIAPNLVYDESPAISAKEKLDKIRTARGLALLKNKIQEEYKKHEDLKQTVETQSKMTNLRLGQKNTVESDTLDLENQEGSTEEPMISPNRSSKFSNKNLPVKSQRRKDFQKHISTQNKDLGSSNDSRRLRVNSDKHISHITKDIVDDGTDKKSTTNNVVQNRYTALLNKKIVNNVDLDADQLNQSKKKTEINVSETLPISKQDLKYTVKGLSQTHQNMEMKHTRELATQINMVPTPYDDKVPDLDVDQLNQGNKKTEINVFKKLPMKKQEREKGLSPIHQNKEIRHTHKLDSQKNNLPTVYTDKASRLIIETIRGHSKVEDESVCEKKQNTSMEHETNISAGQKIIAKLKQEIRGGIKGDSSIVRDKNVEYISKAYLESAINKTFEKSRYQPATDVVNAHNEQEKSADMENQALPVVVPSTLVSSDQLVNNFNNIEVSVTLTGEQKEASSDLVIEHPMYKPANDSATNHTEDIKTQSVDINNHSGHDIPVLVTSAKHSWDPGTYRVVNLINQGETYKDSGIRDDLLENVTDLLAQNYTEEPSPHIKKRSTEGIIIKIVDMKDSIGEDFTGLTDSSDDSNKHIGCTIKAESANMSVITRDMCTQNILADSFLSGETIGHNLEDQVNLGEHNVISVETKKQPEENSTVFVIQKPKINKVFENVFEVENRGMEKDVTNMKEQNVQQTIVLSAEIRDQPLENLEKQEYLGDRTKYSSLTFLQEEDNSKSGYTTDVTVNESIDVENFRKNVENIAARSEPVDKCFLEKTWWVKEDHRFEYEMYQVDGLIPVTSIDALQEINEIETCGPGRYAQIKQSLDQVDVVSPKKTEDITEITYKNEKTEIDNNNWTAKLDQAMDECENVTVEKSEDFMDLKLTKERSLKNGQENEDQRHITTDVRNQSQDAMNIFSENYIVGQTRIEELDDNQHEGVIHGRENALDFTQEAETLATKESKHEVNHTNSQALQPMDTAVNIREHLHDNSNRELKQDLVNTVVDGQLENDIALSQKQYLPRNLDEKLVEGISHLPLLKLKPMDNQEKVHGHGTETSNSIASLMSSELLKAQHSNLGHNETSDAISVTSQGDDEQSHLSLPKLITLDIQKNVYGLSTETSNSLAHVMSSEPLDVQMSYLRDTETTSVKRESHLSLPELKTIDSKENVYEHSTETSNFIAPVMSSEPLDVQIPCLRDAVTTSHTSSVTLQSIEAPLPELKTIDNQESVFENHTETDSSIAPLMTSDLLDVQNSYLRNTETKIDTLTVTSRDIERQSHVHLSELKTIDTQQNVKERHTETSNSIAPMIPSGPLDVKMRYLRDTDSTGNAIGVALKDDEGQSHLPLSDLKTIDIQENVYHINTEASNSIAPVMPSEPLDGKIAYLKDTENTDDAISVALDGDERQIHLPLSELKIIDIPENVYHLNTEASNSIAPVMPLEPLDEKMPYLRDIGTTGDTISVALQGVEVQSHLPLSELKTIDIQENVNKFPTETSNSILPVMLSEPLDLKMSCLRDKETTGDTISVALQGVERKSHTPLPELKTIDNQENKNELHTETSNFIADVKPSEPLDVKMPYLRDTETTGDTIRVALQGFEGQSNIPLPELKTIDSQESIYESYKGISNSIESLLSSEPSDIQISYSRDAKTSETIPVATESNSGPSINDNLQTFKNSPQTPKEDSNAAIKKNVAPCEEEEESPENMESWVNKLRQLETPEFLRYQKPRRQPHSTQQFIEITLPTIKEDQGSPKCDQPDFNWQLQEKEETLKVIATPSENNSALETKASEQSEQSEEPPKKFSWERSLDKITVRSSPLELMRKHSGEEGSRSENYKALITQSLSQRQSSIIGSLLLSDRLDKKSETSEGKLFSRLESSYLLSSYIKPKIDLQQEKTDQIGLQDMISTDNTNLHTTSDSLTSASGENTVSGSLTNASEANTASDSLISASGASTASDSLASASGANTISGSLTSVSEENAASDSLTSASGENIVSGSLTSASGANAASDSLTSASGDNAVNGSLTSASGANPASDSLTDVSGANTVSDSLTSVSGENAASDSLTSASGENTVTDSLTNASGANTASDSLTDALGANTASDSLISASGANTYSGSLTSASAASTASDSLASASGANTVSDFLTSASEANTVSDFLTSASGANTASGSLTSASGANIVSGSLTSVSGANAANDFFTSASGANMVSDSLTHASGANTVNGSLTSASGANAASDSLTSASGANTVSDSLTSVSVSNRASDSLTSASGENAASDSLTSASGENAASDSLTSASEENRFSDSLTNASGENTSNGSLTSASGANAASDSLTNALGANTVSDTLTSASGVNAVSDSLTSTSGENTVSDSLTSVSVSNIDSDSLTDALGANTVSDTLTSASGEHTVSESLTSASGANTGNVSLNSSLEVNTAIVSLTSVSGTNITRDSTNTTEAGKASEPLSGAPETKTTSNSLTSAQEENKASDSLISASGPNKAGDSLTSASVTKTNSVTLTNASGANGASDILSNAPEAQQPEDKEYSSQLQSDNVPTSDSTKLLSKREPPVASHCKVFPDVWLHPEKIHGKLNPRPGKIILFSEPGFRGHRHEIYSDVGNMSDWELQGTVSICIVRGGWLLYEKPQFRGKRVMLTEGDTDLPCPWKVEEATSETLFNNTKKPKFWIGSLRHVVRDFQVPRISLFTEENGEGNKVTIAGATPDSRAHGHSTKTESIIVHNGLWLVYSKPFFEGDPYILEPGGYPNRKAWNGQDSHMCSLQPARIGGPTVEKPNEPKILLFKYPGFQGPVWEVFKDLNSLQDELNSNGECLLTVGSVRILGGCWVGYENEGFHGHQYLLEEGKYKDWSTWGGYSEELGSLRHICTDFSEPEIVLYEQPGCSDGPCLRLNEALSDIELAQYGTKTESIHVLNGVWVAYENVDFSGEQYILEKGIYHSYQDWGAKDSRICSVQPVLQVGGQSLQYSPKIQLFSEPNFHGDCMTFVEDHSLIPESFSLQSCRVEGGSWSLYEDEHYRGEQYILSEGDYPTRTAMGCQGFSTISSLKRVPLYFSVPSISLHGLEKFGGKELNFTGEVRSLQGEGYNNHVLSIKVKSGLWVLYEHSDFRGRQWLLEHTQIPNWLLYSGLQRIGSLCPIRQRRVYFRLQNRVLGLFLCVPEQTEDVKAARVHLSEPQEGCCDLWFYEDGRIKNQLVPQMSLQVVGLANQGTKVVLWSEQRKPVQTWSLDESGYIISCLFKGLCLDIKGGNGYDSKHVVVWEVSEDRPTQRWDLKVY